MPAISIRGLVKDYFKGRTRKPIRAVDGIDLDVHEGEIFGLLGPNGAGKTTTIKMTCGLVRPTAGSVAVLGHDVERQRAAAVSRIGAVLEGNRNVYWPMTAHQNLRYFGTLRMVSPAVMRRRSAELLDLFGLSERAGDPVRDFSRGMQQKLAIACALIHDPAVLLLDEPTLGLDVQAARTVKERVRAMAREEGRTVVLTTHQMDVAQELCDRIAIVSRGRIIALDRVENLIRVFSRQQFRFRVEGALAGAARAGMEAFAPWSAEEQNGTTVLDVTLADPGAFYRVTDVLRECGARVQAVEKVEPDLEEIFVHLTSGEPA